MIRLRHAPRIAFPPIEPDLGSASRRRKILVIRRDNIGDLVCTTPLLTALRERLPDAWIGVLANSYNAPVLAGDPHIDQVFSYCKAKHGYDGLSVYLDRARLVWRLRRMAVDDVILAAPARQASAERFARWIAPRRVLGGKDVPRVQHEVEKVFDVLRVYGIDPPAPACSLVPDASRVARLRRGLPGQWRSGPVVGIHISARKPSQRWPAERFVRLMRDLHRQQNAAFLLFWSPGSPDNPQHPGDDDKAAQIAAACPDLPLAALPTTELRELVAGLALADCVICSDGGAMHVAAGLGKPIVCLFGASNAARWRPWAVPYELLQKDSQQVLDISVGEVLAAYGRLAARGPLADAESAEDVLAVAL